MVVSPQFRALLGLETPGELAEKQIANSRI